MRGIVYSYSRRHSPQGV